MPLINNRPPIVTGPIVANMTEDGLTVFLADTFNSYDPDLIDLVRGTGLPAVMPEGITYDSQFHMFVIDPSHPAFQALQDGQVAQIIVNFLVTDGFDQVPQSLILTVTGQNDAAVIGGTTTATLAEDAVTSASGSLTVTDIDTGEAAFQPVDALAGAYGTLWLTASGQWSYILNNNAVAVQALVSGQTVVETFAVQALDGTQQILTLNISGADETVLVGTAGQDVLTGTAVSEMLLGLAGRDLLTGNGGGDTLDGGAGADSVFGNDGNDLIVFDANDRLQDGGAGVDTLQIGRAATVNLGATDQVSGDAGVTTGFENVEATYALASVNLTGSAGMNILAGGAAADRLTGGLGSDVLFGNGGADRFILRSTAESQGATADEIADFTHGVDKIDLAAIDAVVGGRDNAFSFIGGTAFSRAGQLRYDAASGEVQGDVTGDQVADFALVIGAGLTITATDFIL